MYQWVRSRILAEETVRTKVDESRERARSPADSTCWGESSLEENTLKGRVLECQNKALLGQEVQKRISAIEMSWKTTVSLILERGG